MLYFANGSVELTYDGVNWDVVTLPKRAHVKSILIDNTNRIYVGALVEIGYLEPTLLGKLEYISLVPKMKGEEKTSPQFGNVLQQMMVSILERRKHCIYGPGKNLKHGILNQKISAKYI